MNKKDKIQQIRNMSRNATDPKLTIKEIKFLLNRGYNVELLLMSSGCLVIREGEPGADMLIKIAEKLSRKVVRLYHKIIGEGSNLGEVIPSKKEGQRAGEIRKQSDSLKTGSVMPEGNNGKTLSEIGLTAKQSSMPEGNNSLITEGNKKTLSEIEEPIIEDPEPELQSGVYAMRSVGIFDDIDDDD